MFSPLIVALFAVLSLPHVAPAPLQNTLSPCDLTNATATPSVASPLPTATTDDCSDPTPFTPAPSTTSPTSSPPPTDDCSDPTAPPTSTPASSTASTSATSSTPAPTSATSSSAPAPTSSILATVADASNGPFIGGVATYYYQNGNAGACGQVNSDNAYICAMDQTRFGTSGPSSPLCGRQVQITNTNTGGTVTVTIADDCPTCDNENSIDLSVGAFSHLAALSEGEFPISWTLL